MTFTDAEAGITRPRSVEIITDNYPKYMAGANYNEVNKINKFNKAGYDTFQIAHLIGLVEKCVIAHLKPPRQKPGPKPRDPA